MVEMRKGQTSVDIIMAILVALVFFAVLNIYNDDLSSQVSEISMKNGMKSILLDVYSATASAKAYGISIDYTSPRLKVGQSQKPLDCAISFRDDGGSNDDSIYITSGGKEEKYNKITLDDITIDGDSILNNSPVTRPCGEKFTIARSP
ncbi:MAG TPA: hypothetical protein VJH23_00720 [archaeon]|nr:hypothetical protein [archaeon]